MNKILLTLTLLLTATLAAAEKPTLRQAQDLPNFIFILSDDIAQGDLGVYGQELIKMPTLDRLANEGAIPLSEYLDG